MRYEMVVINNDVNMLGPRSVHGFIYVTGQGRADSRIGTVPIPRHGPFRSVHRGNIVQINDHKYPTMKSLNLKKKEKRKKRGIATMAR